MSWRFACSRPRRSWSICRKKPAETQRLYGIDEKETAEFGTRCLLARRLVEKGVRFVQLYSGDTNGWDAHNDVAKNHARYCRRTDKPVAGLLTDLKRRGLWDDTLVIWGGEFGRMPMSESGSGRDHNPWGYTMWLAGGGVRGGMAYGATDPLGLRAEQDKVHIHDLHATILHLLGPGPRAADLLHNGRDERLTDTAGRVIKEILHMNESVLQAHPTAFCYWLMLCCVAASMVRQAGGSRAGQAGRRSGRAPADGTESAHGVRRPIGRSNCTKSRSPMQTATLGLSTAHAAGAAGCSECRVV